MKKPTLLFAALALLSAGCHSIGDEVQPRSYDALVLETGHWEWESTSRRGNIQTPAAVGFTRQLVFSTDGQVLIQHDGKLNKKTSYALSMGPLTACGQPQSPVPLIAYKTDSDVPNDDLKTYSVTKSGLEQTLTLAGATSCIDGGAVEKYHWVAE